MTPVWLTRDTELERADGVPGFLLVPAGTCLLIEDEQPHRPTTHLIVCGAGIRDYVNMDFLTFETREVTA